MNAARSSVILGLCLLMMVSGRTFAQDSGEGQSGPKMEDVPKLTVRGKAELEKPADQVRLRIGVITDDVDAGRALRDNTDQMNEVVKAITKAGVEKDEYETGQFRIRPQYTHRPRGAAGDWKPEIIGYEVVNSVTIRTKRLELTGTIIEVGNRAGANTVEIEAFEIADERIRRSEAIREATRHAIEDARDLADAAGVELVRILAINLDNTPVSVMQLSGGVRARAMADAGPPPIAPGDVTVRAGVTIVYEIRAKKD